MKKTLIFLMTAAFMTIFASCDKKNNIANVGGGNEPIYVEFGASSSSSKINYDGVDFTWSSTDALSCYAGAMQNKKFTNKLGLETQSAVFACNDAIDWGTNNFYVIYPYKEGGYTIADNKISVTVPTEIAADEDDYTKTIMFGKADNITPAQLSSTSITMNQVYSLVRVQLPAVAGQKAVSVTISNENANKIIGKTMFSKGNIDLSTGKLVGTTSSAHITYEISGTVAGQEAIVNLPVIPTSVQAGYTVTVLYKQDTKIKTIYSKHITKNSQSNFCFVENEIIKVGFYNGGSYDSNCKYTVYDWIEINPTETTGRNYIETGLFFDRDYFVKVTVGTTAFQYNRWYIGHMWNDFNSGFELGEYNKTPDYPGQYYWRFNNGTISPIAYQPYMYQVSSACTVREASKQMFFLNRAVEGVTINDCWYGFKCYDLRVWEGSNDYGELLLNYYPVKNNANVPSMFDVISGRFCDVKGYNNQPNGLTVGNI